MIQHARYWTEGPPPNHHHNQPQKCPRKNAKNSRNSHNTLMKTQWKAVHHTTHTEHPLITCHTTLQRVTSTTGRTSVSATAYATEEVQPGIGAAQVTNTESCTCTKLSFVLLDAVHDTSFFPPTKKTHGRMCPDRFTSDGTTR